MELENARKMLMIICRERFPLPLLVSSRNDKDVLRTGKSSPTVL